tara:strand:- start:1250 stop:1438 length:189 start_codon:yes stop_codon:yes gene_type:complete
LLCLRYSAFAAFSFATFTFKEWNREANKKVVNNKSEQSSFIPLLSSSIISFKIADKSIHPTK